MYTCAQKVKVVDYARHYGIRAAGRHFGVHHRNIQRWIKNDVDMVPMKCGKFKRKNRKGQGRKISYPQHLEEELVKWVLEKREESFVPVSTRMIRLKALSLIKDVTPGFKASECWVRKFLKRNNLVLRAGTSIAQSLPADLERKLSQFRQSIHYTRQNGDFAYSLIANMDETPIFFDMVPSKTVDRKGKKTIRVRTTKSEKRRVTAVLACTAAGNMLSPMIIFKGTTTRTIRGVSGYSKAVVTYQKNAWIDEQQMLKWIREVWVKYTKQLPSLLILDSCSAHLTNTVQEAFKCANTTVLVIPGGCTPIVQPLDVSINKPVKQYLRASWEDFMLEQSSNADDKINPPPKQSLVDWIICANEKLHDNPAIAKKAFLVTGISNALGGYEDQLIRNDEFRSEIDDIIQEVFGDEVMEYSPEDQSDDDPFSGLSDTETDEHNSTANDNFDPDSDSLAAPDYEELTDVEIISD